MNIQDTSTKIILIVVVVFVGLIVTGAVIWGGAKPATAPAVAVDIKDVKFDGDPVVGQASAPVTIAFWSDYQCPICKQFELGIFPQLMKDYVDTGKAKIVIMDLAFLGNDSTTAALYGRAIWKLYPSLYLKWREAMYTAQDDEHDVGFGDAESIDKLNATIAGLDVAKIIADVKANGDTYQPQITADRAEAVKAGVNGTPSFIIGTQLIVGNQQYSVFKSAIDALVK